MGKMTISVKEAKNYEFMDEVFQDLGYWPAEESDSDNLICYTDLETGLDAPTAVSVIARYSIKFDDLLVEVAAGSYDHSTNDGSIKDIFYTFIGTEIEHPSFEQVKKACKTAERAAKMYISALKAIKGV